MKLDNIILLRTNRDRLCLDKLPTVKKTLDFVFKESSDSENPSVIVTYDSISDVLSVVNYAYLSTLSRYYFIKNFVFMSGGRIQINLALDVLHTFKDQIKLVRGLVDRQEKIGSPYFNDERLPVQNKRLVHYKTIGTTLFDPHNFTSTTNCIALTVTGGEQ